MISGCPEKMCFLVLFNQIKGNLALSGWPKLDLYIDYANPIILLYYEVSAFSRVISQYPQNKVYLSFFNANFNSCFDSSQTIWKSILIKMSCKRNCDCEPEFVCLLCKELYCLRHGEEHQKELGHIVEMGDEKTKAVINQNQIEKILKIEKLKKINQIILSTSFAISKLEQYAEMKINSVKEAKVILDFKVDIFGSENYLLYLAQVGLINKGIYFISNDQVVELNISWGKKIEDIEELRCLINNFEIGKDKIEADIHQNFKNHAQFQDRINILEVEKESITENYNKIEKNLIQKEKEFEELYLKFRDIECIRKLLVELEAEEKKVQEEKRIYREKRMNEEINRVLKGAN